MSEPDPGFNPFILLQYIEEISHKLERELDHQSALFLLLHVSWSFFPLIGKWGDFVDYSEVVHSQFAFLCFVLFSKSSSLNLFMNFIYEAKQTNKYLQKYYHPASLHPYIAQKGQ